MCNPLLCVYIYTFLQYACKWVCIYGCIWNYSFIWQRVYKCAISTLFILANFLKAWNYFQKKVSKNCSSLLYDEWTGHWGEGWWVTETEGLGEEWDPWTPPCPPFPQALEKWDFPPQPRPSHRQGAVASFLTDEAAWNLGRNLCFWGPLRSCCCLGGLQVTGTLCSVQNNLVGWGWKEIKT